LTSKLSSKLTSAYEVSIARFERHVQSSCRSCPSLPCGKNSCKWRTSSRVPYLQNSTGAARVCSTKRCCKSPDSAEVTPTYWVSDSNTLGHTECMQVQQERMPHTRVRACARKGSVNRKVSTTLNVQTQNILLPICKGRYWPAMAMPEQGGRRLTAPSCAGSPSHGSRGEATGLPPAVGVLAHNCGSASKT
jgi:hypothetical protein